MKTFTTPEIVALNIEETANGCIWFHTEDRYKCWLWRATAGGQAPETPGPGDDNQPGNGDDKGDDSNTSTDDMSN